MSEPLPPELITGPPQRVPLRFVLSRRKRWVSLLIVIGLGLILLEMGLRLSDPPLYRYVHEDLVVHYYAHDAPMTLHPQRNARYWLSREDGSSLYRFAMQVDALGLRRKTTGTSREPTYLGRRRIVVHCLGDGLTLGWGVEAEESWPDLLQVRLGPAYHVMNLGVDGFGLIASTDRSERFREPYAPDVVIWAVGVNDFADDERTLAIRDRSWLGHMSRRAILKLQRASYLLSSPRVWAVSRALDDVRSVSSIGYEPPVSGFTAAQAIGAADAIEAMEHPTLSALAELKATCDARGVSLFVVITDMTPESLQVLRYCRANGIDHAVVPIDASLRIPADVYFSGDGARQVADGIYDTQFKLAPSR